MPIELELIPEWASQRYILSRKARPGLLTPKNAGHPHGTVLGSHFSSEPTKKKHTYTNNMARDSLERTLVEDTEAGLPHLGWEHMRQATHRPGH